MNIFVQSVFTVEVDSQNAPTLDQRTDEKLSTIKFSPETVKKHLEKLKVTKSSGPDQMHPLFLHETAKIYPYHWQHFLYIHGNDEIVRKLKGSKCNTSS
jgi:hypothetical protein